MAKGRIVGKSGRGVDQNAVARSQDNMSQLAADTAADVDMEQADYVGKQVASAFLADETGRMKDAVRSQLGVLANGSLQELEGVRRALAYLDQAQPGLAAQLYQEMGAPESLAAEFGGGEAADIAMPAEGSNARGPRFKYPPLEQIGNYGQGSVGAGYNEGNRAGNRVYGLREMAKEETRPKGDRVEGFDPDATYQQRILQYITSPDAYRAKAKEQLAAIGQTPLTPEMLEQILSLLDPKQAGLLVGVEPGAVITPEMAAGLNFKQRDIIVPFGADFSNLQDARAGRSRDDSRMDVANEAMRYLNTSTRDQKIAGMLKHAEQGTTPVLDDWFKWWRYQWPTVLPGQSDIVRPATPPSGDFLARLTRGTLGLEDDLPSWVTTTAPVFDRAVRQQYMTVPKSEIYRGVKGKTAMDFANLRMDPARGGYYLKQAAAQGWPFQQFIEGLSMNRGPNAPINLGGLLLDSTVSAPQPDGTISTPETAAPPPVDAPPMPDEPPVMPSDNDLSMYDPRIRNSILAALLA